MARRRMMLRRIDPWSVLKFGAVVNACLLVITLLGFGILWFAIRQLGVIDQACDLATDVGFESCAVNGGNLFRYLLLLGLLWVVIQTGLLVFFAFLHNLIADLVGGVEISLSEEGGAAVTSRPAPPQRTEARQRGAAGGPPPRDEERTQRPAASRGTAAAASGSAVTSSSSRGSGSRPSGEREDLPDRAPSPPPTAAPRRSEQRPAPTGGGWPWDPQQSRGTGSQGSSRERSGEERSTQERTEQQRPQRQRSGDDDNLFGPRDR